MFDKLINYIERGRNTEQIIEQYDDGRQRVLSGNVACETNCFSLETAASEMNIVSMQNVHCKDPVYHFILSWQEDETPANEQIFDCARYCMKNMGLDGHQFVTAIHKNTDNIHCHVAVNRINQKNYRAANMWNDADTLQKCCRILERHYGFNVDNGSWCLDEKNKLQRVERKFKSVPCGAVKRAIFSDSESLYHYANRKLRQRIDEKIHAKTISWDYLHLLMRENGLGLREHNGGLVIFDLQRPDTFFVKASSVHSQLTKSKLASLCGPYKKPSHSKSQDPEDDEYAICDWYNPYLHVRDKDLRRERREARAAARAVLKARYDGYRKSWEKPDIKAKEKRQKLFFEFKKMKENVRISHNDPLIRKLMYRVIEFERMKALALLSIELRQKRKKLYEEGKYRALNYRTWVEQEALKGDCSAISQIRGWTYKNKRRAKLVENEINQERIIFCDSVNDSPLVNHSTHTARLLRDGTIEYLLDGITGVIDRGNSIEIKERDDDDKNADYKLAVEIASMKNPEKLKIQGDDAFINNVLSAGIQLNSGHHENFFQITEHEQKERYSAFTSGYNKKNDKETIKIATNKEEKKSENNYFKKEENKLNQR